MKELRDDPEIAPWLAETPAQMIQQTLRDLDRAWADWIKGSKKLPRYKRKSAGGSVRDPQGVWVKRVSRRQGILKIQGLKGEPIVFRQHRPLVGKLKHATVTLEPDGQWYVSLTVAKRTREQKPSELPAVGVDLGVVVPVALSTGERLGEGSVTLTTGEAKRLLRLERQRERQTKRSHNRRKTQLAINRLKARARRRRKDFIEQSSSHLAKSHGLVVFENLSVKSMTASAKGTVDNPGKNVKQKAGLNRAILDRGWGDLVTRTTHKVERRGGRVVKVPAAYSSQECPGCGHIDAESRVTRSRYCCTKCDYKGHADTGAARIILKRALSEGLVLAPAGGTPVAASQDDNPGRSRSDARAVEPSRSKSGRGSGNHQSRTGLGQRKLPSTATEASIILG